MDTQKYTIEEFGQKIKEKYPQYASLDDKELGLRTLDKYPEYQSKIKEEQAGFVSGIKADLEKRGQNINEAFNKDQSFLSKTLQLVGQGAGFVGDIAGEAIKSVGRGVSAITPDVIEKPVVEGAKKLGVGILNTELGQAGLKAIEGGMESYNQFKQANPETAGNLEAVINIASLFPIGKGAEIAGKTAIRGGEVVGGVVKEGAEKVVDVAKAGAEKVGGAIDVAKTLVKGTGEVIRSGAETIKQIPSKVAVNVAEKQAERKLIQSLPSKVAQDAVAKGINIDDAKFVTSIKPQSKPLYKKLFSSVEKFDAGISDKNPVEIIGKPIVDSFQKLKTNANTVGKQLGDVADNMGIVSKPELTDGVFNALKQVNGLTGLKLNRKGALDFSNTTLASSLTKSDRKAIQEAFNQATKWGNAKKAHQFRQELFEVLGGKKKGGVQITDTQDKAYQAIRKGLSDVLETKNPQYKKLSNEYRKLVQPIQDINNMFRAKGLDEDILQLKAGTIMRRLTSNAPSKAELQQLLRNVDKVLGRSSKAKVSSEDLQNFYNILERYYPNITNETSFKGQLTSGIEATGMTDALIKSVKGFAGETDAVRKQALKDLLKEVLK